MRHISVQALVLAGLAGFALWCGSTAQASGEPTACHSGMSASERNPKPFTAGQVEFDCSITNSGVWLYQTLLVVGVEGHTAQRAKRIIFHHRALIARHARRLLKNHRRFRRVQRNGRRIGGRPGFPTWLSNHIPRFTRRLKKAAIGCGAGAAAVYVVKRKNGKSHDKALAASVDGCVAGVVTAVITG